MKSTTLVRSITGLLLVLLPMLAQAHTALTQSTPAADATVKAPPASIGLTFNGPVRLIKLEVMGVGHEMPTKFEPQAETRASYSVETPGMHPGAFTVNWAVIGEDGHTVTNSFAFTVDPTAEESAAP
jgi:copper resistance protein C